MEYSILNGSIIVKSIDEFNCRHIIESGQMFRYVKANETYKIISQNKQCVLILGDGCVTIGSNNLEYFLNYFDLNRDYSEINKGLSAFPALKNAVKHGKGLRLLNQDVNEAIFSFIISANNNIPRIKSTIERLCSAIGQDMGGYRAFPTAEALAGKTEEFYKGLGLGYRAEYILNTAKAVANGFNLNLAGLDTPTARAHLMKLKGVGQKVADCILLFAYKRTDCFPVDVWIERVYNNIFGCDNKPRSQKAQRLTETFGNLSGYAQQYLFYHARENKLA
jgi:N-glycosylase/DNA lyase